MSDPPTTIIIITDTRNAELKELKRKKLAGFWKAVGLKKQEEKK